MAAVPFCAVQNMLKTVKNWENDQHLFITMPDQNLQRRVLGTVSVASDLLRREATPSRILESNNQTDVIMGSE